MATGAQDFSIYAGEAVTITVTLTGSGSITGWTLVCKISNPPYVAALVTRTIGSGVTITDAANRIITITLTSAQTTLLGAGAYKWSLARTDSGSETVLTVGSITINPSANQST